MSTFFSPELRLAALDFRLELAAFFEQGFEDFFFRDVGDFFALHVDDPAAIAGEDRDVGAFAFAGAVHDAAHHRDLDRQLISSASLLAHVLHQREQIHLDSPAGRAGDQLGADALAQAEDVEQLQAVLHFVNSDRWRS